MSKRILYISNSFFISGAELSLNELLKKCSGIHETILVLPQNTVTPLSRKHVLVYFLPLKWFQFTLKPVRLFQFVLSIILSTFFLARIINRHKIELIYANTTKANIYAVVAKIFTKKKIIWQVRDNIRPTILNNILIRNSDAIVSISEHIDDQITSGNHKKYLIYGGLDVNKWIPKIKPDKTLKNELGLPNDTRLIVQVGQLTQWKNHPDFIRAAGLILQSQPDTHFLIIGDDLSGREGKYKTTLRKIVDELQLGPFVSFLGNRHDIKELLNQIDILIHPAINEPFGRVIIEAMAMEKPVVAYDCGGPKEIIEDSKTGYLVEPYDYKGLAEKTICLLENEEIRIQLGKAGRERVIEKFNIESHVKKMEELFNQM